MINVKCLGSYGRLGNQMFQYATAYMLAKKHNTSVAIPSKDIYHPNNRFGQLVDTFELSNAILDNFSEIKADYIESSFTYDPNVLLLPNGINLQGYFQSEKYFLNIKEELLNKEFVFKKDIKDKGMCYLSDLNIKKPLCSIHVRLGDYTKLQDVHYNLPLAYYLKATNRLSKQIDNTNIHYLVFSDDIQNSKNMFSNHENITFINEDYQMSLFLMTKSDYHIIANSSFSWWGSWLSNSKKTIAPSIWFGPKGPNDWKDIYSTNWVLV